MPAGGRMSKEKPKSTQSKLTNFGTQGAEQLGRVEANANSASASPVKDANNDVITVGTRPTEANQLQLIKDEILGEIRGLKEAFTVRLDGVLKAIEETRKEMSERTERQAEAEVRLSAVEDEQVDTKNSVVNLLKRNKYLEDKIIDMATRSRLNNIRVVGLPERCEGYDTCGFLESWLSEALDLDNMRSPLILERAHRIGPMRDTDAPPRTVIMRFLNYKQKEMVLKAAKAKKDVLYKNHRVRLYADMATEVHRQRKRFDAIRAQLRQLGIRHGILSPATLVLTYKEVVHKFNSPEEAKDFVKMIQMDTSAQTE